MERLQAYLDILATSPYWQVTLAALVVTVIAFFANVQNRAKIDAALKKAALKRETLKEETRKKDPSLGKPLYMFALSHGNADITLNRKCLVVPERLWTYDDQYLGTFAKAASSESVSGHGTALELYIKPTLRWDIVFAIALGLFTALFDFGVANALLSQPYASRVMLFLACMGVVYGAADVAEDIKLASILTNCRPIETSEEEVQKLPDGDLSMLATNGSHDLVGIDGGEAAAANVLTRVKIVALTLSVVGAVIFVILSSIATLISALANEKNPTTD